MRNEQDYILVESEVILTFEEKKEQVIHAFKRSFDREAAYRRCGLSTEEKNKLNNDQGFQERLDFHLVQEQERVIENLRDLMASENDMISLKATMEYGKVIYPEKFNDKFISKNKTSDNKELVTQMRKAITEDDYAARVLEILLQCGVLTPRNQRGSLS